MTVAPAAFCAKRLLLSCLATREAVGTVVAHGGRPNMRSDRRQQGYSLVEMLVVLAIIGLMSVITIPQFINYQQSMKLKSALRVLNNDLINARQLAITRYWQ